MHAHDLVTLGMCRNVSRGFVRSADPRCLFCSECVSVLVLLIVLLNSGA